MGRCPIALAWSGGKDSSLALAVLQADPTVEVIALITTVTRDFDRISMHGVRRDGRFEYCDLTLNADASWSIGAVAAKPEV